MINTIKSEFRKLITVRSTYVILILTTLILILFAFYAQGYKAPSSALFDSNYFFEQSEQAVLAVGLLGSLVGVLLMTHEYRYNTITYTLTASNSRTRVLLSKVIVVSAFAVAFSLFVGVASPLLVWAGIHAKGGLLIPQHLDFIRLLWHDVFVGWGYSILAFIFALIVRAQVGAISTLFLFPAMIEPLLGLALKKKAIYLPYNSLQSIAQNNTSLMHISAGRAVAVFTGYIIGGLLIGWILFLRRDATS